MNLCDVNLWLALTLSGHAHAAAARRWFDQMAVPGSVLFCRVTQQAYLRLLTNAAVLAPYGNPPLSNREAWAAYEALLADDRVMLRADEPPGIEARWREAVDGRLPGRLLDLSRLPDGDDGCCLRSIPRPRPGAGGLRPSTSGPCASRAQAGGP